MKIKTTTLNCGESGTTARSTMIPVARGVAGHGIFIFTGEGRLPTRDHRASVDQINGEALRDMMVGTSVKSFAVPANREYHMPVRIYVGAEALRQLIQEIREGKYEYFRYSLFNFGE